MILVSVIFFSNYNMLPRQRIPLDAKQVLLMPIKKKKIVLLVQQAA